jgi:hypothetical protein
VTQSQDRVWQAVDAVVRAGHWNDTVFLRAWDDWGGRDDHVATPNVEHTPDGVQPAYGPRVPLLMFGARVPRALDFRWDPHSSIGRHRAGPCWICHHSAVRASTTPVGPVLLRDGTTLPPPDDQPVH